MTVHNNLSEDASPLSSSCGLVVEPQGGRVTGEETVGGRLADSISLVVRSKENVEGRGGRAKHQGNWFCWWTKIHKTHWQRCIRVKDFT